MFIICVLILMRRFCGWRVGGLRARTELASSSLLSLLMYVRVGASTPVANVAYAMLLDNLY
eukprot:3477750-Pyramimonas_sp.AAC.1